MVLCGCINNGSKQKYDGDDDDVYYYIRWLYIFFSGSEKPALKDQRLALLEIKD